VEEEVVMVNQRGKRNQKALHKVQVTAKKTRKQAKFIPPKVKVPQASFDDVLGKLIQSRPEARKK
jgi:hypothetical protein